MRSTNLGSLGGEGTAKPRSARRCEGGDRARRSRTVTEAQGLCAGEPGPLGVSVPETFPLWDGAVAVGSQSEEQKRGSGIHSVKAAAQAAAGEAGEVFPGSWGL